jgi:hypothetical protein
VGRVAAVLVAGVILIGGIALLSMNKTSTESIARCVDQYDRAVAHSNAVSAANMAIGSLVRTVDFEEYSNARLFDSWVSLDTFRMGDSLVKVLARAYVPAKDTAVVEALVDVRQSGMSYVPRATVVARTNFTTRDWLVIDGRDHDMKGALIPESGTLAISTTERFRRRNNSEIGGTCARRDYQPARNYHPCLVEERAVWANGFPDTPDQIFGGQQAGFPEGRLAEIAKSGAGGSQYVTDPRNLTWPLRSLTYVDLPSSANWTNIDFSESSGILVVHNTRTSARMRTLRSGQFSGIIIADRIDEIDNQIIGAVTLLIQASATWRGWGTILFSHEAIESGLSILVAENLQHPHVLSWYE